MTESRIAACHVGAVKDDSTGARVLSYVGPMN